MGYSFKRAEPVEQAVSRMLRELAADAVRDLSSEECATGVHEARKRFKKARALLRLVRPGLGDRYDRYNGLLRDAGHRLASMREADALLECFERLAQAQGFGRRHQEVRHFLEQRRSAMGAGTNLAALARQVQAELTRWRQSLRQQRLEPLASGSVVTGLVKSYRAGRNAWRRAAKAPAPESFHDWRKRVKAHGYQLRLVEKLWPAQIESMRAAHDELAELLGDDHDLVLLDALLAAEGGAVGPDAEAVRQAVAERQRFIRGEADRLGARLYAERPRHLARRLRAWWEQWEQQAVAP